MSSNDSLDRLRRLLSGPAPDAEGPGPRRSGRFGRFLLQEQIGRGGAGAVYRALEEDLGRVVALKILHTDNEKLLARFSREAKLAARLSHPHIVPVHEVGEVDGTPYLSMRLIEGKTLEDVELPPREAAEAVRQAAEAVEYAHSQGIVHRDLKPANLLYDRDRNVWVTDFGLAKELEPGSSLTRTGATIGTPLYMAPEQAAGRRSDVRTDVYGLGATLYRLLAGRPPWTETNLADLLDQVRQVDPPPPSRHAPGVPPELETLVLKAMEKDPARRFASAREFADELSRYLEGRRIETTRPSAAARWVRRRTLALVASVLALGVAGLVVVQVVRSSQARAEERRQSEERERVLQDLSKLWADLLLKRQRWSQAQTDPRETRAAIEKSISELGAFLEAHPGLPQAWYVRARGRQWIEDLDGALADATRAVDLAPDFAAGWSLVGWLRLERQERARYIDRMRPETQQVFDEEVRRAREALQKGRLPGGAADAFFRPEELETARVISTALMKGYGENDFDGAVEFLKKEHRSAPSEEACYWIGWMTGAGPEAEKWQTEALRLMPHFGKAYRARGYSRFIQEQWTQASLDCDAALQVNPNDIFSRSYRAQARVYANNMKGALEDCDEVLRLRPGWVSGHSVRAWVRRVAADYAGALEDDLHCVKGDPTNAAFLLCMAIDRRMLAEGQAPGPARKLLEQAESDLRRALELSATFPGVRQTIEEELGRVREAVEKSR